MEHKTNEVYVTGIDQEQGIIKAIFSVMGNVDYGNDRIYNGAFAKTFQERGHKVLVLDQHRTDSINRAIAKPIHLRELGRDELPMELLQHYPEATGGAEITAQFSLEDEDSKKAFFRLKNGWVKEWSFGYDPFDTSFSREDRNGKKVSIRNIRTIKLYEVSPVLFGMNDATMTTDAKSAVDKTERVKSAFEFWQKGGLEFDRLEGHDLIATKDGTEFTVLYNDRGDCVEFEILSGGELMTDEKGASGKMNLPLASRDMAWDSGKAVASIRNATGSTDAPSSSYKNGFFWYDPENEDEFTAYKLPFAQEVDGSLKAVPKGVFAVAAVLQGGRGGVDIPETDVNAVKARVASYYAKMKQEFEDDSIVPPWQKEGEKGDGEKETEQKEPVQEEQNQAADSETESAQQEKAGRAISANNETRIRDALTGLQSAMEALNGMLPVEEEEEPEQTMELDDNLNTVTVSKTKQNHIYLKFSDDFDVDMFIKMFDKFMKQSEHETDTDEAGPIAESPDPAESPTKTEVKESPFDFEKALQELANLKTEFMEVHNE